MNRLQLNATNIFDGFDDTKQNFSAFVKYRYRFYDLYLQKVFHKILKKKQ